MVLLTLASIWAKLTFLNFAMPSTRACQATVVLSSIADQATRITAAAFLLAVVGDLLRTPIGLYGVVGVLSVRALLGVVGVGFTRPQLAPICVARSQSLRLSAVIVVFDAAVITWTLVQSIRRRAWQDSWELPSTTHSEQAKARLFYLVGYTIWFVVSLRAKPNPTIIGLHGCS